MTITRLFTHATRCVFVLIAILSAHVVRALDYQMDTIIVMQSIDNRYNIYFTETTNTTYGQVAGRHYTTFYFSSDQQLDTADVRLHHYYNYTTINPYVSGNFGGSFPNVPDGIYYIIGVSDSNNDIIETNESNNIYMYAFRIFNLRNVDFELTTASTLAPIFAGASIEALYRVSNTGTDAALESPVSAYLSSDSILGTGDAMLGLSGTGQINGGGFRDGTLNLTIPENTTAGSYYVLLVADASNLVSEVSEANNVAYFKLIVQHPDVDLAVMGISLSRSVAIGGSKVLVNASITNLGKTFALPSILHYYISKKNYLDGSEIELTSTNLPNILPSTSIAFPYEVFIPESFPGGSYKLLLVVESNLQVETNESNNIAYKSISITKATRDLAIRNIKLDKNSYMAGALAHITYTVSNNGNSPTAGTSVNFYLSTDNRYSPSDVELGSSEKFVFSPKQTITSTSSFIISESMGAGRFYIVAFADAFNYELEANETNNQANKQIRIVPPVIPITNAYADTIVNATHSTAWKVFPNPVENILNVQTTNVADGTEVVITLQNLLDGKNVLRFAATILNNKIEYTMPPSISRGHYFLHIDGPGFTKNIRVLKE